MMVRRLSGRLAVLLAALVFDVVRSAGADLMEDVDYRVIPRQRLTRHRAHRSRLFFLLRLQWCYQFETLHGRLAQAASRST